MKILYIHQYFKTPEEGGAIRSYYLAKGLVDNGYEVDLITSHNQSKYFSKEIEGITVHYLPVKYSNYMGFSSRIFAFLKFMYGACKLGLKLKKSDLCYASSTPLTVGLISLYLKFRIKLPYIFEVRDLWPEAPIQIEAIKNKMIIRVLRYLERKIYIHAEEIVALSPGIASHVGATVGHKKITVIPNMADIESFPEPSDLNLTRKQVYDKKEDFYITYFGAVGKVNNLQSLILVAENLKKIDQFRFQIIGDGSELPLLKSRKEELGLRNLNFIPHLNKKDLQRELENTDASYISYLNLPVLETGSPNKVFDSLAAGKLLIFNIKGWLYELCHQHQCGVYLDPDDPEEFIGKLKPFLEDRELLRRYQGNARNLALKFSKKDQVKKLLDVIRTYNN